MTTSSLRTLSERVLQEMTVLVGCPAEGITGARRDDDAWVMNVEVLEMGRVPETADVLATYEVRTDASGQIVEYQRQRRYLRGQTDG
jgi:hypothetical protein